MNHVQIIPLPEGLKTDGRGWVLFPFQNIPGPAPQADLWTLHVVRSEPGAIRGNHYHPGSAEWLHIFGGRATFHWEEDGQVRSRVIDRDDVLIFIPPGISHAVTNDSDRAVYLWAFREPSDQPDESRSRPIV